MTNQQEVPEALRLADELAQRWGENMVCPELEAAAELRRLHAENERLAALVEAQQPAPSAAAAVGPDAFECLHEWDGLVRTSMPPKYACKHCHNFFDAPPSPTPQADSQPAPMGACEIAELSARLQRESAASAPADSQPAPDEATAMNRTRDLAEAGRWPSDWVEAYRRGYSDRAARAPADSVTAPAGGVAAVPVKQCPGIPRPGCNYLAQCESVCNKCGKLHSARVLEDSQPVAAARRWSTYEQAIADPIFQTARSIMGTENIGQDRQLVKAINHVIDSTPPTQAQAEPKSGAKSFQTYGEANAYSKGYYAGKKAATKAQAGAVMGAVDLPEALIHAGMQALLQCSASELENLSPMLFETYSDDVQRVFAAMTAQAGAITPPPIECNTEELQKAYAFGWWSALEKQRETVQAGAVPLTNARLQDISLNYSDSEDECTGFRDGWRAAEKHYGIKGDQHG